MKKKETSSFLKRLIMLTTLALVMSLFFGVSAFAAESLTAPTGLKQTDASKTYVDIQWDTVSEADGYLVEKSTDNSVFTEADTTSLTSKTIFYLQPSTKYFVRVKPYVYSSGSKVYGPVSASIEVFTRAGFTFGKTISQINATKDTVSLAWDPVPGAIKYKIYKVVNGVTIACGESITPSFTVTGLTPGTDTLIHVTAVGVNGPYTDESTDYYYAYPKTIPETPAEPTTAWSPITKTIAISTATTTSYQVELYKGNKKVATLSSNYSLITYKTSIKNTILTYRLRSTLAVGDKVFYGDWSPKYNLIYTPYVKLKKASSTSQKLSWKKVTGATSYTIYRSTTGQARDFKKISTTKKTSYLAKKLKKNKLYYFCVIVNKKEKGKTYSGTPVVSFYMH